MDIRVAKSSKVEQADAGFTLVALVVTIFLVLLALSVAAPKMAMQLKRDREIETQHRANEYTRAIRLYYRKFQNYPTSLEQLENTNNQKFLRQKYKDPLTGEANWRLIHFGENKTTVKGFFGADLPGLAPGLGSAAGMSSGAGANLGSAAGLAGGSSSFGSSNGFGSSSSSSGFGSSSSPGSGTGSGATGSTTGSSSGSGSGTGTGSSSSGFGTSVGPIIGIGTVKSGPSILDVNQQGNYQDWEFLYDPRIEQLYANVSIFGGGIATGGSSSGLGSASGMSGLPGATGTGSGSPTSGTGTSSGAGTTPPQ